MVSHCPSTEESRSHSIAEGSESLTKVSQVDLQDNANFLSTTASLHARFEGAANTQEIPADEYRRLVRELNAKQRATVMFHRSYGFSKEKGSE